MEFPGLINIPEPKLAFEAFSPNPYHNHPLKGLSEFGPYSLKLSPINNIRIATICPSGTFHIIKNFFNELNKTHQPQERYTYLIPFTGFGNIFKTDISLLPESSVIEIDGKKLADSKNDFYITLSNEISNALKTIAMSRQDFDVLAIYLPEVWSLGFSDKNTGFDLHDFIKATSATYNIPTQIIRESSAIKYKCRCSVMWRISIALYVKAGGVPWKLASVNENVAFVGLSYAMRHNTQTDQHDFTTCCSQVFDSDGTGLEFIAYDVGDIDFRKGDNPFLTRAEMRKVISKSLMLYQKRHSGRPPQKLIVHKTTYFTNNEIDGAFDAVPSHIDLELLQIVEDSPWRAIKFNKYNNEASADGYPIARGSYLQTGPQEIMLWTQGNAVLNNKNFYKEGKGIPGPLTIRRFAGDGGWDLNCQAIMGLTKMNWNHDALYDRLPVTLGYAKTLATTIKRMQNMANKNYEYRFFM